MVNSGDIIKSNSKCIPVQFLHGNKNDTEYEVSVVVCSYNPRKEAMMFTLESIIAQEDICLEIIIADDGSEENLYKEIEQYFDSKNFTHWTMICSEKNYGTVHNLYTGLNVSKGQYIKSISPGDALNGKSILRQWVDYNRSNKYQWSFSDATYYIGNPSEKKYVRVHAHPNNIKPYLNKDKEACRWNYTVLHDNALGAALISERQLMIEYIEKILNRVIYAEDLIWQMMMFDDIVGGYFSKSAILYEYGTGISTNGSDIWRERIAKDWKSAKLLMLEHEENDELQKSIIKAWELNSSGCYLKKLLIKGKLKNYIMRKVLYRKTI